MSKSQLVSLFVFALAASSHLYGQQIILHTQPMQTVQTSSYTEYVPQTRTTYKAIWNCDHYDVLPSTTTDYHAVRRTTTQYGPVQQVPTAISVIQPVTTTVTLPVSTVPVFHAAAVPVVPAFPVVVPTSRVRRVLRALAY